MKIHPNQIAPNFVAQDAQGNTVRLSDYRGSKVFLVFFRVVGCPTCHFVFHEIQKREASFKSEGLIFLAVYASSPEMLHSYVDMEGGADNFYGTLPSDAKGTVSESYGIESSFGKLLSGLLLHGGFTTFNLGNKLFKKKLKDEGQLARQGAEFLINELGEVVNAHYGKFSGDFIDLADVAEFAASPVKKA